MAQDGCPEELGLRLETFELDEPTNSAICQPTVFLFLTPETYSLPRLLQHSCWGGGQDDHGQSEGDTERQRVGRVAGLVLALNKPWPIYFQLVSFIHSTKGYSAKGYRGLYSV